MVDFNKLPADKRTAAVAEAAAADGMDGSQEQSLAPQVRENLTALRTAFLQELVDDRLFHALTALSPEKIGDASVSALNNLIKNLAEKRQLLKGAPTEIVDDRTREELKDIMPRVLEEARRRGILPDEMRDITPGDMKKGDFGDG